MLISLLYQKRYAVDYDEAECYKIDPKNKKVFCKSTQVGQSGKQEEFEAEYDYLVVAMGARSNTFNIPGVVENAHFLKVPDICRELDLFHLKENQLLMGIYSGS